MAAKTKGRSRQAAEPDFDDEELTREEAQAVIGRAEALAANGDRVRVGDLVAAGRDIDIAPEKIRAGVAALRAEQQAAQAAAREAIERAQKQKARARRARRAKLRRLGEAVRHGARAFAGTAAVIALVALAALLWARSVVQTATARFDEVAAARANVRTQMTRTQLVVTAFSTLPPSPERDAEIAGAYNRATRARVDYDTAVRTYNDYANDDPVTRFVLGRTHLPARAPYSNEVETW